MTQKATVVPKDNMAAVVTLLGFGMMVGLGVVLAWFATLN